jgi:phosphate-selective porin
LTEISNKTTQSQELRVSLRGKLAQDYTRLKASGHPQEASRWIRQVVKDAVGGHPQLAYRMEADAKHGQRFVVGLQKELGTMSDW